jgi:carbon storage regulator CsrA
VARFKKTYNYLHKNGVSILLILGRRTNQSIVFPNCGITVRVLDVNGRVAKIGIEAPRHIEIMRGELATATSSPSSSTAHSLPIQDDESLDPELPLIQFTQRLSDIKASLHVFQQRRAAGDESGADQVLGDLLNDLAVLDSDWLSEQPAANRQPHASRFSSASSSFVSENGAGYEIRRNAEPLQVLILNDANDACAMVLPAGMFHGCQVCTVSRLDQAIQAVSSSEPFDYVVCNGSQSAFDDLELVRTIRSNTALEQTKVFMTSDVQNALEQLELSNSYCIDGWLARPLLAHDLWKHIVECEQVESEQFDS